MRQLAPLAIIAVAVAVAACSTATTTLPAPSSPSPTAKASAASAPVLSFGTTATVQGGTGRLRVTPFAAWRVRNGGHLFLITEMKLSADSGPATVPLPVSGDGLEVVSAGQVVSSAGDDASSNVAWNTCLPVVDSATTIQPGDALTDGITWDMPASSGVLRWQDADGSTVTWRIPAKDTGPLPAKVKAAADGGDGC